VTLSDFARLRDEIADDPSNAFTGLANHNPVYQAGAGARILVVGQAPGWRAQESGIPWDDASGRKLRSWLQLSDADFYDPALVAILPMDFYFPGKGKTGDLPPRKPFAARWHPPLIRLMPSLQLTLLIGSYAQRHYLGAQAKSTLTETVRAFREYPSNVLPLAHPSPLNFRWQARNPWFESEVLPELRRRILLARG
jgi:uracil-DNA glycosylase